MGKGDESPSNSRDDLRGPGINPQGPGKQRKHKRRSSRRRSNPQSEGQGRPRSRQASSSNMSFDSRSYRRPSAPVMTGGCCHRPPIPPESGHELKKFYSRGSNVDYNSGDDLMHSKKLQNSFSLISGSSDSDDLKKASKMCRSESEGGNLENSVNILNGNHIFTERRNTDSDIDKSGRIQYSREFLLNLQYEPDSLKTPKGLTVFPEIIQNGNVPQHQRTVELTATDIQRKLNGRHLFGGDCHDNLPPSHMHSMFPVNQGFPSTTMRKGSSMSLPSVAHPPNSIMPPRFSHPQHPTMMMMMGNSPGHQQQHAFIHQHHPVVSVGRQLKGKSMSQQSQQQQPPRKVIQVCLGQNVQLHQSENAWKPMTLLGGKKEEVIADPDESAIMDLYRKVRSILNKLTPQKFDTLIQQVHDLSIDTEEKLKGCIKLIFEKAIGEPSFSLAYAQMAKSLNNLKVYVDDKPGETVTFRKLLLNQCQKEFEKDKLEELDLEKMTEQIEKSTSEKERQHLLEAKREAEKNAKRRSLGNIRFIGELFKLKMLTEHIMYECISRLLRYSDDEDNVECLCRLLVTIGRDLDNASLSSKQRLNQSFHELKQLASRQQISSRIKFMIQDVQELRENDWIPRREDTKPKLIEQIHKEAEMEGMHKKHLNMQFSLPEQQQLHQIKGHHHHHQHLLPSSMSVPYELQRSSSLASSSLDRPRGSVDIVGKVPLFSDGRQQSGGNHNLHHQYQGRGSIDRNLRHVADRFGSLERVRTSEDNLSGGNGHKMNIYATMGHIRRYSARPLTGNGSGGSSSEMGKTIELLKSNDIQLAPISYKLQQHKPWQEGSLGGRNKQITDQGASPLPTSALRSRGSASDIYNRSLARSPLRIAPRSRLFDPKSLERDKHAAIAAAKSISSSASADSFINPYTTSASFNKRDSSKNSQHHANHSKPPHSSSSSSPRAISLSPRDLASRQKELEKKCQSLLDEYLSADDLQEACLAFKELHSSVKGESGQLLMLMTKLVNSLLEKSSKDRHKMAVLLSHLVLKNLTSVDVFLESLSLVLKDAKDISIDIPKVWDYLAELVSRAILSKVFSFTNLSTLCRSINDQEKQAEFIAHVIKATTSSFDDDLNIADQPSFVTDLILFLSSLNSNGKGDNKSVNEDLLMTHSDLLKNCLNNSELEWQVLMQLKKEIFGLVDTERAPATISSIVSTLNKTGILSSATMVRWNDSLPACK